MLTIKLMCAGGASTGMLAQKMQQVAEKVGLEADISATSVNMAASEGKNADVILLGPQVGYRAKEVQAALPNKIVLTMDMADYGRMNARGILKQVVTAVRESRQ